MKVIVSFAKRPLISKLWDIFVLLDVLMKVVHKKKVVLMIKLLITDQA